MSKNIRLAIPAASRRGMTRTESGCFLLAEETAPPLRSLCLCSHAASERGILDKLVKLLRSYEVYRAVYRRPRSRAASTTRDTPTTYAASRSELPCSFASAVTVRYAAPIISLNFSKTSLALQ